MVVSRRDPARLALGVALTSALALGAPLACTTDDGDADGGTPDGGRTRPLCDVDRANEPGQAAQLVLDTPNLGLAQLCPATDVDWYTFEVPARGLLEIELGYPSGATTPVQLAYNLFGPVADPAQLDVNRPLFSAQDDNAGDNRSSLKRAHYLQQPGRYFVRVRDVGDDEEDRINRYNLTVRAIATQDPGEPNDACDIATPLTTTASGAISYQGDVDAFTFTVPAGVRVVDLQLGVTARTPLDPDVRLYATSGQGAARMPTTLLGQIRDTRGEAGNVRLHLRSGLESTGGTYCLLVGDDDGDDADPAATYTLALAIEADPDGNEAPRRNDTPDTATRVGPAGGTFTGVVASNADLDWYLIDQPAGRVVDVDVRCPGCGIQPLVNLVYGHPTSPCDATSTCDYLLVDPARAPNRGACNTDMDCESRVCRAIPGGQKRCAQPCGSDLDCPGFSCNRVGQISACVGAAVCAAGQCGVLQYTSNPVAGGMTADALRTAQPMQGTPVYLLVHDLADDEFATNNAPYTLQVQVAPDPDRNEPNNFYYPFPRPPAGADYDYNDTIAAGRDRATTAAWRSTAGGAEASGSGCVGYAGDVDIFRLAGGNPCTVTGTTGMGMRGDCGLQLTYARPNGQNLEWAFYSRGFGLRAGFEAAAEGMETVFGDASCALNPRDNECFVYEGRDDGDYYLSVRAIGNDAWDVSGGNCYTWTLRAAATPGCPASCRTENNRCTTCQ